MVRDTRRRRKKKEKKGQRSVNVETMRARSIETQGHLECLRCVYDSVKTKTARFRPSPHMANRHTHNIQQSLLLQRQLPPVVCVWFGHLQSQIPIEEERTNPVFCTTPLTSKNRNRPQLPRANNTHNRKKKVEMRRNNRRVMVPAAEQLDCETKKILHLHRLLTNLFLSSRICILSMSLCDGGGVEQ